MARRPLSGWDLPHNKRSIRTSMKDIRRRRDRRRQQQAMRRLIRWLGKERE